MAPLDLRDIHERAMLAEASQTGLDMLRQTADLKRLFLQWEGTMVCHAIDPDDDDDDDDDHVRRPPHRLHLHMGKESDVKRWSAGASCARACWRPCDERRPAPLGDQRVGGAVKMLREHGGYSPSDFNVPWLSAYDLLVGVLLLDVAVRASKFCWRSLRDSGGEVTTDGGKALPPAPSGDDLMMREWVKFRADFAGAEARIKQGNRADLESLYEIVQRGFDQHSRGIQKNLTIKMKKQKEDMTKIFARRVEALARKYTAELEAGLAAERAAAALARGKAEVSFQETIAALKARLAREASEGNEQHDV
ncbi:unnamed protein product, partial [Ectocarpus sp. 12 AP-2014]